MILKVLDLLEFFCNYFILGYNFRCLVVSMYFVVMVLVVILVKFRNVYKFIDELFYI